MKTVTTLFQQFHAMIANGVNQRIAESRGSISFVLIFVDRSDGTVATKHAGLSRGELLDVLTEVKSKVEQGDVQ